MAQGTKKQDSGLSEGNIQRRIMIAVSKIGARFWRNNVALAWVGKAQVIKHMARVAVEPGDVVVRQARPLHAGLCPGSSDLVGIVPLKITEQHVGTTVGVFGSLEIKATDGRVTPEQENWREQISSLGGLAGVARCEDDAIRIISKLSN